MKKWIPIKLIVTILLILVLYIVAIIIEQKELAIDLNQKNTAPSLTHLFGTDWLGRDMLIRTWQGLSVSLTIGIVTAFCSTLIALLMAVVAGANKKFDRIVRWMIDLFLSLPHLVTLLLITFTLGGGVKGLMIGLIVTHWTSLARLLRVEVLQLNKSEFIKASRQFGKNYIWIVWHHFLPHLYPQIIIGAILIFPHAILHEAAVTFLGFGLSTDQPAIGIILSESMSYLSAGYWWLAFFPGLFLLSITLTFQYMGKQVHRVMERNDRYDSGVNN